MKKISLMKSKNHVTYAKKSFVWMKMMKILKSKRKTKDHCHYTRKFRGAAHNICNLRCKVPENIPILIHNASCDTHFIINQLAEEFKGELNCIGENMEKYITFSVPIKKKCDDSKTITYKLRFIDSFRFMPTSFSELVDNVSANFNSVECKSCTENNRCEECKKNNRMINQKVSKYISILQR